MALPINIEDLLNKRKVESNRIEFKKGWNPDKIYHSICAFANDIDNIGGGYIIVGVEEKNGIAKRPVLGIPEEDIDDIMKAMVGYDAKISPHYMSKVSHEIVDGQSILVIWVPAGIYRPYSVMESVVVKKSTPKFYIRSKSSSIEAKGEILDELRELANRVPFDERGNPAITTNDISSIRLYEHLKKVNSKLADDFSERKIIDILDEMDLLTGPTENRLIKNCAAMMFCENPERFFPVTQVDIVLFPEGCINNPDTIIEIPKITGPVPTMIKETLSYIRTNIIKKKITKPTDSEESNKAYNYPYQAIEEAVVNALYHRDYQEREPVEITIEPTHIDILSYAGPDRSISAKAIQDAQKLKARRYRNRRLGDFLKELDLTEGRATGIPTIQKALKENGSAPATIETDDNRTYFLMTIPCREDMIEHITTETSTESSGTEKVLLQVILQVLRLNYQDISAQLENTATKILQVVLQVFLQVWGKNSTLNMEEMVRNLTITLLSIKKSTQSSGALIKATGMNTRYMYKQYILNVLINEGYIEMTLPNKPQSSNQSYRLTSKGEELFK
ncbi:MAG: putative DNA binding domain-containing protein [Marinifilaceae bacterium]|nr:putative DNA binding domain-containing protein [Marinifilaceae bacterium]